MPQTYNLAPHFDANCRVWVFIAERKLNATESQWALEQLLHFTSTWQTHGKDMNASGFVFENAALVLVANEEGVKASGCSMDKINHQIKNMSAELGIDFFNRMHTLVKENEEWQLARFDAQENRPYISAATQTLSAFLD
ncbi:MAG: hypothetical protein RLZZ65_598 [Bacteroidota bacterium]|jgi:hypothetical protein